MNMDPLEEFHKSRKGYAKYQPFKIGSQTFPGLLQNHQGNDVKEFTMEDQIKYLDLHNVIFSDASVLDIGSNIGAFSIYAAERGATEVLGIEISKALCGYANKLRDIAKSINPVYENVSYELGDFMTMDIPIKFDIALFLAVLHHCPEPYKSLERLFKLCTTLSVLEVQVADGCTTKHVAIDNVDKFMNLEIDGHLRGSQFGLGYYPTKKCLYESLRKVGFSSVQRIGSGKLSSRIVLHAFK